MHFKQGNMYSDTRGKKTNRTLYNVTFSVNIHANEIIAQYVT
jgi:hypothetical protein